MAEFGGASKSGEEPLRIRLQASALRPWCHFEAMNQISARGGWLMVSGLLLKGEHAKHESASGLHIE